MKIVDTKRNSQLNSQIYKQAVAALQLIKECYRNTTLHVGLLYLFVTLVFMKLSNMSVITKLIFPIHFHSSGAKVRQRFQ